MDLAENVLSFGGKPARIKVVTTIKAAPLETCCELADHGRFLVRDTGGGFGGDSGGAWLVEQQNGCDVLIGIIQGVSKDNKAAATPPAPRRKSIDMTLKRSSAKANWVTVVY